MVVCVEIFVGVFLAGMVVFTNLSCIGTLIVCWVVGLGGV